MRALGRLFLFLLLVAATIVIWEIIRPAVIPSPRTPVPSYPPQGSPPYPSPSPPPQPGAQPPPAGSLIVNLAIVDVRSVPQQGGRSVQVTVLNRGPAIASQASGWCSYRCPSTGTAANGLPIFQRPLAPGESFSGSFSFAPCPDPSLYVECLVQPGYGVQDPNFSDNRWSGTVATR